MENETTPELLTPRAAAALYVRAGIAYGRGLQTLARMQMGQPKITDPSYMFSTPWPRYPRSTKAISGRWSVSCQSRSKKGPNRGVKLGQSM
jgi:hypothetical protein